MNNMKLTTKLLFLMTLFVVPAITFTACSSEDDLTAKQEQGVVKAEFAISIPRQMSSATRMADNVVQLRPDMFRGISKIELMPFKEVKSGISTTTTTPSSINLLAGVSTYGKSGASGLTANTITNLAALYTNSSSHLYKDIEIAVGTRSFMFYGLAIDKATSGSLSANTINGSLVKSTTGTQLGGIKFSLTNIFSGTTPDAEATEIVNYLNAIAQATDGTQTMVAIFPGFKQIHAGSWNSVKAIVQQVYTSVYNNTDALSTAIKSAILTKATDNAGTSGASTGVLSFTSTYTYPANIGLPDGAAYINWVDETGFVPLTNDNMGLNITSLNNYVYPASLYYFGLSNIKTSTESMESKYDDNKTWAQILAQYTENTTSVQTSTRSIAIEEEIQYAVGRLDVTVHANSASLTDKENQSIPLMTNDHPSFPITGVLIGNQKAVDYKFETIGTEAAQTIYDSQISGAYIYSGSGTAPVTHTLVLQTVDATTNEDNNANVPVAVEFKNLSEKTIVGKDNQLIYPNTTFYLVGTLKPNENTTQKYSTDANSPVIKKAFVQDYVTTANFTVKSFQNAYNYLPDLRVPHLEIGLSVDLQWKTGITFPISID